MSNLIFFGYGVALLVILGVIISLVHANVRYYRDLKRMTPEEREKFKEEERCDLQTW